MTRSRGSTRAVRPSRSAVRARRIHPQKAQTLRRHHEIQAVQALAAEHGRVHAETDVVESAGAPRCLVQRHTVDPAESDIEVLPFGRDTLRRRPALGLPGGFALLGFAQERLQRRW